jgi:hypothetical protein
MSVKNAMEFIELVKSSDSFRTECYKYPNIEDLMETLNKNDQGFTPDDFENAINMSLIKCQTYDQADIIKEVENWFKLFGIR